MDLRMKDAVRTVGQLLLHRPASGWYAYNNKGNPVGACTRSACSFCFTGATKAVSNKLKVSSTDLLRLCNQLSNCTGPHDWDTACKSKQVRFATRLANYQ